MTVSSFPWSTSPVYTAQWELMARRWRKDGVIPGITDELLPYADSTGMQVKVKAGDAWARGHYVSNSAELILSIDAADSTNGRIDCAVLRVDFSAETVTFAIVKGTPAVSPTAPALTDSASVLELKLADILVGAGVSTISAANVSDRRKLSWADSKSTTGMIIALGG